MKAGSQCLPAGPVRQVLGNDPRGLLGRGEAFARMGSHKADHAGNAAGFHLGRNVDQSERTESSRCAFSFGDDPGQPAKRRADQGWFSARGRSDCDKIGCEIGNIVSPIAGPCAVAMSAQIDCDRLETMAGEQLGYGFPRPAGLPATVRQNDRKAVIRAIDRRRDFVARLPREGDRLI
jgi:hypothetical protein